MQKKLNILALSSWYPNEEDPQLGIFIQHQLEAIATLHNVTLITLRPDQNKHSNQQTIKSGNLTHHQYSYRPKNLKKWAWYNAWSQILRFHQSESFDLIHLHVAYPIGIIGLQAQSIFKAPIILGEHWSGYGSSKEYKGTIRKYYTKKLMKRSKKIVVQSNYLKNLMLSQNLKGDYSIVPNIVKFSDLKDSKTALENFTFINIADHIDSDKNISGLLNAFAIALKTNPKLKLIQIGGGPDTKMLHNLSKKLELESSIDWKGRLTNDEVLKCIHSSNAGIVNSNQETFCVSAFELIASKKPIIISDCGGPVEYLPKGFGKKIEKNNKSSLTKAILDFAAQPEQPAMDKPAEIVRKGFSANRFLERINKVYNSVLE